MPLFLPAVHLPWKRSNAIKAGLMGARLAILSRLCPGPQVSQLNEMVAKFVEQVDGQRDVIEREKLRAVGMRNKVKALEEDRRRQEQDEALLLEEKREELARLTAEYESLKKVKQEQDLLIDRLTTSGGDS